MLFESHRLTQRWEASLWLEGRQLYLGGFQTELDAARAYDIAALSCKGPHVQTNYPEESYAQELQETAGCSTVRLPSLHLLLLHALPLQLLLLLLALCFS